MKRAILMVVVLASSGCACPEAHDLTVDGEASPPYFDVVLQVAQGQCGRPIVGTFEWTDHRKVEDHAGYCSWDGTGCPMSAWAVRPWTETPTGRELAPAMFSLEAHEIGHWCRRTSDEGEADRFAYAVNAEAWDLVFPGTPYPAPGPQ